MTDAKPTRAINDQIQHLDDSHTLHAERPRKEGRTFALAAYRAKKAAELRRQFIERGRRRMEG